jgi:hypothetical protein
MKIIGVELKRDPHSTKQHWATITLLSDGKRTTSTYSGNTPDDAVHKAIKCVADELYERLRSQIKIDYVATF